MSCSVSGATPGKTVLQAQIQEEILIHVVQDRTKVLTLTLAVLSGGNWSLWVLSGPVWLRMLLPFGQPCGCFWGTRCFV